MYINLDMVTTSNYVYMMLSYLERKVKVRDEYKYERRPWTVSLTVGHRGTWCDIPGWSHVQVWYGKVWTGAGRAY